MTFTAQTSGLGKCIPAGTYSFFCPQAAGLSTDLYGQEAYIQCKVCGTGGFTDTDATTGTYTGSVTFGPNMLDGVVDESMLDSYAVFGVDDCGAIVSGMLGWTYKSSSSETCCDSTKYSISISVSSPSYSKIMVVPASGLPTAGSFLNDGVIVDLVDLTTTTTLGDAWKSFFILGYFNS